MSRHACQGSTHWPWQQEHGLLLVCITSCLTPSALLLSSCISVVFIVPAAGLKAIYLSGWQVAGDANSALQTYPDQSLYAADSVPKVVERINNAFMRADQIQHSQGKSDIQWFAPIVVSVCHKGVYMQRRVCVSSAGVRHGLV